MKVFQHISAVIVTSLFVMGMFFNTQAAAEEAAADPNYSGDFWTSSTMTGDWGGTRNDWAKKGVTFDMSLTQTEMGVVSGGKNREWEYSGRGNVTLNVDTQKLGLWPGGFLTVEVEGNYDRSINLNTGAISPVNTNQLFPVPNEEGLNIPAVTFMQFLSHNFGVVLGKLDTTSGDANEFAHGKGDTQFMNLAFNLNPALLLTSPNSVLGGGVIILPTKDPEQAIISAMVFDSNGKANTTGFDTAFEGDNTYAIEGRVRTNFFGKTGHQLLGWAYSTKEFSALEEDSLLLLKGIVQNRTLNTEKENSSWAAYYNFDQYLYEPEKGRGVGIFGRFGASDGDANPVHYFYSLGVGGKGMMPSRPNDDFGIGFFYMDISNPKLTGIFKDREFLQDEYGVEAYYNIAITPWMKLTPDIQIIRAAQEDSFSLTSIVPPVITRESLDTVTVLGLRLQMIF
ncbi:MAG: carbohydrate porin [Desulfobulbaceae bacterium]|nr:carbohydrate porin [Desulfobulbaceae bacterium]